jgi:hypothetical protein
LLAYRNQPPVRQAASAPLREPHRLQPEFRARGDAERRHVRPIRLGRRQCRALFTDVDHTGSLGVSLAGKLWGRPDDTFGLAGIVNGISAPHIAYLNAGGLGILVGDGQLPHPGSERIMETYYSFPLGALRATADYQFFVNPAYNRDRGPVSVLAMRLHAQF